MSVAYGKKASLLTTALTDSKCALSSLFFGIFGIVIALMKDVPDVEGDKMSFIRTMAVRLGQRKIFSISHQILSLLMLSVGGSCLVSGFFDKAFLRCAAGVAACWSGIEIDKNARQVDPGSKDEVFSFYMAMWKVFYLSYVALPFV